MKNRILQGLINKAALAVSALLLLANISGCMDESYRIMKVYKITGATSVESEDIGTYDAYEGMVLESGDKIDVKNGNLTIKVDDDKYLFAERGTKFNIEATGSEESGKVKINLTSGSVTSEIQNKLSADSTYEVNAPNSTMAVRGTVFSLSVRKDKSGKQSSYLEVFNGTVEVASFNSNGDEEDSYSVSAGKGLTIGMDDEGNAVSDGIREADISSLTRETVEYLLSVDDEHGNDATLLIGDYDLEEYYEEHSEECYEYEEYEEYEDAEDEEDDESDEEYVESDEDSDGLEDEESDLDDEDLESDDIGLDSDDNESGDDEEYDNPSGTELDDVDYDEGPDEVEITEETEEYTEEEEDISYEEE